MSWGWCILSTEWEWRENREGKRGRREGEKKRERDLFLSSWASVNSALSCCGLMARPQGQGFCQSLRWPWPWNSLCCASGIWLVLKWNQHCRVIACAFWVGDDNGHHFSSISCEWDSALSISHKTLSHLMQHHSEGGNLRPIAPMKKLRLREIGRAPSNSQLVSNWIQICWFQSPQF